MSILKKPALIRHFTGSFQDKLDRFVDEYQCKSNLDYIKQFMQTNESENDGNDILLRLSQSAINRWNSVNENSSNVIDNLFGEFEKFSNAPKSTFIDKLIRMLDPIIKIFVNLTFDDQQKVALVLSTAADRYAHLIENTSVASKLAVVLSKYCRSVWKNGTSTSSVVKNVNLENTKIVPRFRDDKQKEYDRLIVELECKVSACEYDSIYFVAKLKEKFTSLVSNEEGGLRLIQSIIEITGTVVEANQIDIVLYWIWHRLNDVFINVSPEKLLQLISPYLQFRSIRSEFKDKQRNLCAVLTIMTNLYKENDKVKLLDNEVMQFLKRILIEFDSNSGLLHAIICVSSFLSCEENRNKIAENEDFIAILKDFQDQLDRYTLETFYICKFDYTRYKVGFIAQWCLDAIEEINSLGKLNDIKSKSSFDPNDRTIGLKLSPDQLCIRGDGRAQRIRSSYPVTCGVFYYELTLLTNGWINAGWVTKTPKINKVFQCGNNDDQHSISYNGYRKYIFHQNLRHKVTSPQWQAGDVVGCLIDVPSKKFAFYLNGNAVNGVKSGFTFSNEPYFAAVCVEIFQQCYCNFGQVPFKHPPSVTYRTFHGSISKYINDKLCPFCNLKPTGARFVNCDHWKLCHECLAKLKKCPTCNE